MFSTKRACPVCSTSNAELDPRLFSYNSKHGWGPDCVGTGVALTKEQRKVFDDSVQDDDNKGREQTFAEADIEDLHDATCPTCNGTRLNVTARNVKFASVGITEIARLSVTDVRKWVQTLQVVGGMTTREGDIARDLVPEIKSRLEFLEEVGWATHAGPGRSTLSGGEAQRIRLAAQLGSNLQGVFTCWMSRPLACTRGTTRFSWAPCNNSATRATRWWWWSTTKTPFAMRTTSSTLAPAQAKRGGRLVAQGSIEDVQNAPESQTGRYLLHAMKHPWLCVAPWFRLRKHWCSAEAVPGASYGEPKSSPAHRLPPRGW